MKRSDDPPVSGKGRRPELRAPRSERDIAADAVVAIHHALVGIAAMPNNGETLAFLAEAAAVPLEAAQAAWYRREQGLTDAPRSLPTVEQETERTLAASAERRAAKAAAPEKRKPQERECPRCERTRPVEEFLVRSYAKGRRSPYGWCDDCRKRYHKDRYVRVGARVVVLDVQEGDWCVGQPCSSCGGALHVGDRVQGDDLHHEHCRGDARATDS